MCAYDNLRQKKEFCKTLHLSNSVKDHVMNSNGAFIVFSTWNNVYSVASWGENV